MELNKISNMSTNFTTEQKNWKCEKLRKKDRILGTYPRALFRKMRPQRDIKLQYQAKL